MDNYINFNNYQNNQIQEDNNNLLNNNNNDKNNLIKIAIHNVQGIKNNKIKQEMIFQEIINNKYKIVGLTETNINYSIGKYLNRFNKNYQVWTNKESYQKLGSGVALIIHNDIAKYIQKVISIKDRIIYCDLYFQGKNKIRIINCYINTDKNNRKEREDTYNNIIKIIKEVKSKKFKIIIMRDLNTDIIEVQ